MNTAFSIDLSPDAAEIERINSELDTVGQAEDWPMAFDYNIRLVIEELFMNIVMHGAKNDKCEIELSLESYSEIVKITIIDNGVAFNPLTDSSAPDLESDLSERAIGGLGVHLIRNLVDDIDYKRVSGRNSISFSKRK
ncbi:MAG: ATP-binding protein [Albidovulum sp.]|nr:ATP-binding protein [Albidovulum sp.]